MNNILSYKCYNHDNQNIKLECIRHGFDNVDHLIIFYSYLYYVDKLTAENRQNNALSIRMSILEQYINEHFTITDEDYSNIYMPFIRSIVRSHEVNPFCVVKEVSSWLREKRF